MGEQTLADPVRWRIFYHLEPDVLEAVATHIARDNASTDRQRG